MRARLIVISCVGGEHTAQARLAKDNHMIQAFAAKRANQAFCNAILPGRTRTDRPVSDPHRLDPGGEDMSVGTVIVTHQVAGADAHGTPR